MCLKTQISYSSHIMGSLVVNHAQSHPKTRLMEVGEFKASPPGLTHLFDLESRSHSKEFSSLFEIVNGGFRSFNEKLCFTKLRRRTEKVSLVPGKQSLKWGSKVLGLRVLLLLAY